MKVLQSSSDLIPKKTRLQASIISQKNGREALYLQTNRNIIITHPILQKPETVQNQCLGDSYWKKGLGDFQESVKKPKMGEIPPQSPLGSPLRVWTRRAFQASFPPQQKTLNPKDVNGVNPSNFMNKSYVCAQSKQWKRRWYLIWMVFFPYICTSNGISLLLPRFFDKCGICPIFDGLQLVS